MILDNLHPEFVVVRCLWPSRTSGVNKEWFDVPRRDVDNPNQVIIITGRTYDDLDHHTCTTDRTDHLDPMITILKYVFGFLGCY